MPLTFLVMENNAIPSPRSELWAGIKAELPIVFGVLPFGLIFGVVAAGYGIPPFIAWSTSSIIFAGSAQFLALPLIADQAGAVVLLFTTFIINLRHLLYSAAMAPHATHLSRGWKGTLAYLLTDEAFVPTILHYERHPGPTDNKHWFWLGSGLTLWVTWQATTGIGIFLGTQIPAGLGLAFTLALTFIGMIVPTLTNRPTIAAALAAGGTAVALDHLPYNLSLVAAAIVGIAVGLLLEQHRPQSLTIPQKEANIA